MTPEQVDHAHEIWDKVYKGFNEVLSKNLRNEPDEIRDYVEQLVLDEYRPWNYEK